MFFLVIFCVLGGLAVKFFPGICHVCNSSSFLSNYCLFTLSLRDAAESEFSEGRARVYSASLAGYIDLQGNVVIEPKYVTGTRACGRLRPKSICWPTKEITDTFVPFII